jgi:hypothetical protein
MTLEAPKRVPIVQKGGMMYGIKSLVTGSYKYNGLVSERCWRMWVGMGSTSFNEAEACGVLGGVEIGDWSVYIASELGILV